MRHCLVLLALTAAIGSIPTRALAWSSSTTVDDLVAGLATTSSDPRASADGVGGMFVGWVESGMPNTIRAQHIDATGARSWGRGGVLVCDSAGTKVDVQVLADGAGGVFVTWTDVRPGAATVYVQRLDALGAPLWIDDGIPVYVGTNRLYGTVPGIVTDGSGGVIVSYQITNLGGVTHVGAQRLDASGARLWTDAGVGVGVAGEARNPRIASDNAGGAFVVWYTIAGGSPVRAQRLSPTGVELWGAADVTVSDVVTNNYPPFAIGADGTDGLFVAWIANVGDLYAQYVDPSGTLTTTASRVLADVGDAQLPTLVVPSPGEAIIAWKDNRQGDGRAYAQKIDATVTSQWQGDGIEVARIYLFTNPVMTTIGNDVVIGFTNFDLSGASTVRVSSAGTLAWGAAPVLFTTSQPELYNDLQLVGGIGGGVVGLFAATSTTGNDVFAKRIDPSGSVGDPPQPDAGVVDADPADADPADADPADAEPGDAELADAIDPDGGPVAEAGPLDGAVDGGLPDSGPSDTGSIDVVAADGGIRPDATISITDGGTMVQEEEGCGCRATPTRPGDLSAVLFALAFLGLRRRSPRLDR